MKIYLWEVFTIRKIFLKLLSLTCAIAFVLAPGINIASAAETESLKIIEDSKNLIIYQIEESDGNTYEYKESKTNNKNVTDIKVEKYLISGKSKKKVENYSFIIKEQLNKLTIQQDKQKPVEIKYSNLPNKPVGNGKDAKTDNAVYKSGKLYLDNYSTKKLYPVLDSLTTFKWCISILAVILGLTGALAGLSVALIALVAIATEIGESKLRKAVQSADKGRGIIITFKPFKIVSQ